VVVVLGADQDALIQAEFVNFHILHPIHTPSILLNNSFILPSWYEPPPPPPSTLARKLTDSPEKEARCKT
jgi:hypothetical protein